MKKTTLFIIILLLLCGTAWAQLYPNPTLPTPNIGNKEAINWQGGLFDSFYASSMMSTESRYSAGIFTSDIDEYLDVTLYDPYIGTFLFMGGYPGGNNVDDTDYLTGVGNPRYAVNFGFAKTLSCYYLGIYYGGSFVDAYGGFNEFYDETYSSSAWQNNLALFFGTPTIGAFRLDLLINTETNKIKIDDPGQEEFDKERVDPPSIALTWGGIKLAGFDPYITVGYRFARKETAGHEVSGSYKEASYTAESKFGIQAGVNYDICENSKVFGDISFVRAFAEKYSGDDEIIAGLDSGKYDGGWGIGLRAGYKRIFDFGKFSTGFSPGMVVAYTSDKYSDSAPAYSVLELCAGVDFGFKYQLHPILAFYSGASLQVFDWVTRRDSNSDDTEWFFGGFFWDNRKWNSTSSADNSYLGFGMTVTPINNLVIGAGLNTFLDKFVLVDLTRMSVETGEFFDRDKNNPNNTGTWLGSIFQDIKFDLTVSYKF